MTFFEKVQKRHFGFPKCLFFGRYVREQYRIITASVLLAILLSSSAMAGDTCLSAKQQLAKVDDWGKVSKIIDGDTIHLRDGRKIRLTGINTPEIGRRGEASQPFAHQAHRALKKLLAGNKKIGLSYDQEKKDRYKRVLAYVILVNGKSVQQALLAQGLAQSIVIPPNDKHINCYREIEKNARRSQLGLWQLAENQLIDASDLSPETRGYRFISGTVSDYSESKKNIYLKLTPELSIRIAKKDRQYFSGVKLKSLTGKKLQIRGWVNRYKGRQSISVRTAYDLQL